MSGVKDILNDDKKVTKIAIKILEITLNIIKRIHLFKDHTFKISNNLNKLLIKIINFPPKIILI